MNDVSKKAEYVLITPAKNEELYIEKTIESVIHQSLLPKLWVIVSDGSTDRTNEIVKRYTLRNEFIKLICLEPKGNRNFASKVYAINKGFSILKEVDYKFFGNLDGDVSFGADYYERLLEKFRLYSKLGITGGKVYDFVDGNFKKQVSGLHSVAGPIQLFRRECWEEIGGYVASRYGLVDAIAEVSARMHEWETRTFPELQVLHHRSTGSEGRNIWNVAIGQGKTDYLLGYHPLWHLARSIQRMNKRPILLGSLLRTFSFIWHYLQGTERPVTKKFIEFLRDEELKKINLYSSLFKKWIAQKFKNTVISSDFKLDP